MPSTMTHTYFGLDVYQGLPNHCQNKIKNKLEYFKLFCQGSDPFMFYHFFLGKRAKEVKSIQTKMHQTNTQKFFLSIIHYIEKNHLIENQEVMAYLYGYICHYCLDYHTHPFIYYKSGCFHPEDKKTHAYNGVHQEIEYAIDCYFIQKKELQDPKLFKVYRHIFQVHSFSPTLKNLMKETIEKTYHLKNIVPLYLDSIRAMKLFFRFANYDPYGIKLKLYKMIDGLTSDKTIRLQELSYYYTSPKKLTYLNLEHQPWCYPWDNFESFTTSFLDLYEEAKEQAISFIKEVTMMLEKNKINEKRLAELFPDLSFSTGMPCREKLTMKYFEY